MSKNNIFVKLKEDKEARAIAITVTVMVLVLTAIIITTVVANRAAQNEELPPVDDQVGVLDPTPDQGADNPPEEQTPSTPAPDNTPVPDTPTNVLPTRFLLPVSGVLQKNHDATLQVFSTTMRDYRTHLGIDIGTVAGANVSAMADGVIAQVWQDVSMGQCVAIQHGGDALTVYKNLSVELPEHVTVGRTVKAGEVIGTVGESAMVEVAEEAHLHLEMTVGGVQVDPTDYLDENAKATLQESTDFEDVS